MAISRKLYESSEKMRLETLWIWEIFFPSPPQTLLDLEDGRCGLNVISHEAHDLPRRTAIQCKALLLLYLLMVFIHKLGSVVLLIIASTLTEGRIFGGRHIMSPKLQLPSHLLVF